MIIFTVGRSSVNGCDNSSFELCKGAKNCYFSIEMNKTLNDIDINQDEL